MPVLCTANHLEFCFKAFPPLRPRLQMLWNIREAIRRLSLLPGLAGLRAGRLTTTETSRTTVEGLNFGWSGRSPRLKLGRSLRLVVDGNARKIILVVPFIVC